MKYISKLLVSGFNCNAIENSKYIGKDKKESPEFPSTLAFSVFVQYSGSVFRFLCLLIGQFHKFKKKSIVCYELFHNLTNFFKNKIFGQLCV